MKEDFLPKNFPPPNIDLNPIAVPLACTSLAYGYQQAPHSDERHKSFVGLGFQSLGAGNTV